MARSPASTAMPWIVSRSWPRVNTRPGAAAMCGEEVELRGGQLDGPAVDLHRALDRVDDETADDDRPLVIDRVADSPQHGPDTGQQLAGAEGLDDVVVGAELETDHPIGLVAASREHDDRDGRGLADRAGTVEPVDAGQSEVEHDQVGDDGADQPQRLLARSSRRHPEPGVDEVVPHDLHDGRLVIDDEHVGHRCVDPVRATERQRPKLVRAIERQRGSGPLRPAWPGNAMASAWPGNAVRVIEASIRCERPSASEGAALCGLRGRGTQ